MFLRNGDGAMKSAHHRRTGGLAVNRSGRLPNSIFGMEGFLSSMPEIRFRWMICRSRRTTEREIPPLAVFLPGFETKTDSVPSPLGFSVIPGRNG